MFSKAVVVFVVSKAVAAPEPQARLFLNRLDRHQQVFHREVECLPTLPAMQASLQPGPQLAAGA